MTIEKSWKYYLGITLFVYSFVPYATVIFFPLLRLPHAVMVALAAGFVASAEIAFFCSVLLLGKPFIELLKDKLKRFLLRNTAAAPARHIGKTRHYAGIGMMFLSCVPYYAAIALLLFGRTDARTIHFAVASMLAGEALFIASLFVLGGEFWDRLKKLFEWPGGDVATCGGPVTASDRK